MKHRAATAAAARRRAKRARKAADDLEEVMVDVIAKQTRRVVRGFKQAARTLAVMDRRLAMADGSDPSPPVKPGELWNDREWNNALEESEMLISSFVVNELKTDFGINVTGEQPFVRNVVARQVSHIEDWTLDFRNLVTRTIEQGHRDLKSVDEVADDLLQAGVRTQRQANAIARTEMIAASNAASYKGASAFAGPSDMKEWVATPDSRTRPDHKDADGQRVLFDEPFIVGGERGDHPGDRSFSAGNLVNCRCTFKWIPSDEPVEEVAERAAERVPFNPTSSGRALVEAEDVRIRDRYTTEHVVSGWSRDEAESVVSAGRVVSAYLRNDHVEMNRVLRGLTSNLDDAAVANVHQRAGIIQNTIEVAPRLKADSVVFRGATMSDDAFAALRPGSRVVDDAFMSTTLEREVSQEFLELADKPVLWEIQAPEGSKAIFIDDKEYEVLFAQRTTLEVLSVDAKARTIAARVVL